MEKANSQTTVYDFVHPGHKLNAQWPVLDLVSNAIATAFATNLSRKLQISVDAQMVATRRMSYADCISQLNETVVVHEFKLSPLPEVAWFGMDISVISAIVESYFGGEGSIKAVEVARPLSHTESRVTHHITEAFMKGVVKGWAMFLPVEATLTRAIAVDRLANAAQQPIMIVVDLELTTRQATLPCQLMYPFDMLEPISAKLQHESKTRVRKDDEFTRSMQREVLNCELDIRGVLAETQISLGKLLELKTGDFIPLRDVQNVSFKTQNMPLFDARVGSSNGRVSASLSRWHLPVVS